MGLIDIPVGPSPSQPLIRILYDPAIYTDKEKEIISKLPNTLSRNKYLIEIMKPNGDNLFFLTRTKDGKIVNSMEDGTENLVIFHTDGEDYLIPGIAGRSLLRSIVEAIQYITNVILDSDNRQRAERGIIKLIGITLDKRPILEQFGNNYKTIQWGGMEVRYLPSQYTDDEVQKAVGSAKQVLDNPTVFRILSLSQVVAGDTILILMKDTSHNLKTGYMLRMHKDSPYCIGFSTRKPEYSAADLLNEIARYLKHSNLNLSSIQSFWR